MKLAVAVAAIVAAIIFGPLATDYLRDARDRPTDIERTVQELNEGVDRYREAAERLKAIQD